MKRRSVIKNLVVFTGGVFLFPSCMTENKSASIQLKNIKVDQDQEQLLADICETMLPESDTPGSKNLGLHLFVLKMVDDCYNETQRKVFEKGLLDFEKAINSQYGKTFSKCSKNEKEDILKQLEVKKLRESITEFYVITKNQLINGYENSEYFMTNIRVYELVPGRYNGYFRVDKHKA